MKLAFYFLLLLPTAFGQENPDRTLRHPLLGELVPSRTAQGFFTPKGPYNEKVFVKIADLNLDISVHKGAAEKSELRRVTQEPQITRTFRENRNRRRCSCPADACRCPAPLPPMKGDKGDKGDTGQCTCPRTPSSQTSSAAYTLPKEQNDLPEPEGPRGFPTLNDLQGVQTFPDFSLERDDIIDIIFQVLGIECQAGWRRWCSFRVCFCYKLFPWDYLSLERAINRCKIANGSLVSIVSEKENNIVFGLISEQADNPVLIGLKRREAKGDHFVWIDGHTVTFEGWKPTEPDPVDPEKICVFMRRSEGPYWLTGICNDSRNLAGFICKKRLRFPWEHLDDRK